MPRRPELIPRTSLTLKLPEDVRVKLDLHLFSALEGRVPQGDYQAFFMDRIREHFEWDTLNLSAHGMPEGFFVRGPRGMIEALKERLR